MYKLWYLGLGLGESAFGGANAINRTFLLNENFQTMEERSFRSF